MFERYTDAARRALFFARYEVTQRGGMTIEPEHLLLGLLREPKGLIGQIFDVGRVSPSALQLAIEEQVTRGERVSTSVEIPFSEAVKRVLQFAAEEADRLVHSYIGTEHLLLGILREERSTAAAELGTYGITLDKTREAIVSLLHRNPAPVGGESTATEERAELVRRLGADLEQLASDLDIARERLRRIAAGLEALGRDMTSE
jgi:ATP-dependent Clp protease ATP-binding subunit ClpC